MTVTFIGILLTLIGMFTEARSWEEVLGLIFCIWGIIALTAAFIMGLSDV
jgi:hypothetical protein